MTPTTPLTITGVAGSNPSGQPDSVHADPRQGGAQSIQVSGTGFTAGMGLLIVGPVADKNGQAVPGARTGVFYGWPALGYIAADGTSCMVVATIPIAGPYQIVAEVGGVFGEYFSFTVS